MAIPPSYEISPTCDYAEDANTVFYYLNDINDNISNINLDKEYYIKAVNESRFLNVYYNPNRKGSKVKTPDYFITESDTPQPEYAFIFKKESYYVDNLQASNQLFNSIPDLAREDMLKLQPTYQGNMVDGVRFSYTNMFYTEDDSTTSFRGNSDEYDNPGNIEYSINYFSSPPLNKDNGNNDSDSDSDNDNGNNDSDNDSDSDKDNVNEYGVAIVNLNFQEINYPVLETNASLRRLYIPDATDTTIRLTTKSTPLEQFNRELPGSKYYSFIPKECVTFKEPPSPTTTGISPTSTGISPTETGSGTGTNCIHTLYFYLLTLGLYFGFW